MAEASYPFDSGPGTAVDEARWRGMARTFTPNGVVGLSSRDSSDTSLQASLTSGLTFSMADGAAIIDGLRYESTSGPLTKTASANVNTQPRIDRLILQLNTTTNVIAAAVKQGTPGSSPSPPALTYDLNTGVVEVPIARATCPGSASAQNYSNLVDERVFLGNPALVGPVAPSLWTPPKIGDLWYRGDNGSLNVWNGSEYRGLRSDQYAGTPTLSSGTANPPAGTVWTYAAFTVPDLGVGYKISLAAHLHMIGLPATSGYVIGRIRIDDPVTGIELALGTANTVNGGLDTPLSIPSCKPVNIPAGLARTYYFTVEPSHNASFFWNVNANWLSGVVTPVW